MGTIGRHVQSCPERRQKISLSSNITTTASFESVEILAIKVTVWKQVKGSSEQLSCSPMMPRDAEQASTGANESVMFSEEDLVVARAATATGTLLDQLQGKWVRQDGFFMGVLTNGRLRWGEAFRGDSQSLLEEAGPNKVHLRLAGEVHEGSVYVGRRMSIHWADGEIWCVTCRGWNQFSRAPLADRHNAGSDGALPRIRWFRWRMRRLC
eukprot:s1226_g8.t2